MAPAGNEVCCMPFMAVLPAKHQVRAADRSTLSELWGPGRACVHHLELDLCVDFVANRLIGHVDLHCTRNNQSPIVGQPWELVLDGAENLKVNEISVGETVLSTYQWTRDYAGRRGDNLGLAIRIQLPPGPPGEKFICRVAYETAAPNDDGTAGCAALSWLKPEQTSGKKFPFVFSQCQSIRARSMIPCQDTCEIKATYKAVVRCPAGLTVLMSAVKMGKGELCEGPELETPEGCHNAWVKHTFEQNLPIPAYLIALACGALDGRRVGPRSIVWSEKELLEDSAWEFSEMEKLIAAAEELCGEFRWKEQNLLVLPPSFPYGGMENPCLTFITPTLLAKDKSQVHVVANEIAHSWSGNLVTSESWEHIWLNEGLTTFLELKIVRNVYGQEEADLQVAERLQSLRDSIDALGLIHDYTRLIPGIAAGADPDEALTAVPAVKGFCLFQLLENLVGGEKNFQPFLKKYFDHFAGKTVNSRQMRDFFLKHFAEVAKTNKDVATAFNGPIRYLDWSFLLNGPGMPRFVPEVPAHLLEDPKQLAQRWLEAGAPGGNVSELEQFGMKDIEGWCSTKVTCFLDELLKGSALSARACFTMDQNYRFLKANGEYRYRFLQLAVAANWQKGKDAAVEFIASQGRIKYIRPVYKALKDVDVNLARSTFEKARRTYHPICAKMLAKDLDM